MSKEMMDKLMKTLLFISALAIFAGALFKLQHWLYGNQLLVTGFLANFLLGSFEISRLRKIITKFEKSDRKVE